MSENKKKKNKRKKAQDKRLAEREQRRIDKLVTISVEDVEQANDKMIENGTEEE